LTSLVVLRIERRKKVKKYSDKEIKDMYDRNIDMLYRITYTYFKGDKSKVEDAIQDLFLKVIDKNIRFDSLEHEKAWFIVAVRNISKNMLKRKWNEEIELDIDVSKEDNKDNTIDLVMQLPNEYKLPIYLFYYENYSCIEIAKMMDIPENTVYSYLSRGRKKLKIMIEEEEL
jgi:RNA polymerase sigma-70 factor (ECF subfamily)